MIIISCINMFDSKMNHFSAALHIVFLRNSFSDALSYDGN